MEVAERQSILAPGYQLGSYRLERFLGQGGFGVTYLAHDTMLDVPVAIKEYLPEVLAMRNADQSVQPVTADHADDFNWGLTSFMREAQTLARFRHPNIVRVMNVFELNGTAYMVMEYENGRDLKAFLNKLNDRPSERWLRQMVAPIIDGLEEVHRHGYIHRDIKPANIRIREDGSPVLLDFGSARRAAVGSQDTLTALVTAGFAPLEQYNTCRSDDQSEVSQQGPWTDIYALGAVLYYAVTGNAPVDSALRGSALLNDQPDPLLPLGKCPPEGFSPSFCTAIDRALNFKVAQRPRTLAQWRAQLLDTTASPDEGETESLTSRKTEKITDNNQPLRSGRLQAGAEHTPVEGLFEDTFRASTLGPDDPTRVSDRSIDRIRSVPAIDREDDIAATPIWDPTETTERPVPGQSDGYGFERDGSAVKQIRLWQRVFAGGMLAGLIMAISIVLYPDVLSVGFRALQGQEVDGGIEASQTPLSVSNTGLSGERVNRAAGDSPATASVSGSVPDSAGTQSVTGQNAAASLSVSGDTNRPANLNATETPAQSPTQTLTQTSTQTSTQTGTETQAQLAARAVQAQEARRLLELERRRQMQSGGVMATQGAIAGATADATQGTASGASTEATPDKLTENGTQAGATRQDPVFRPAITDRDMAVVLRQFDALSLAIQEQDRDAVRRLTVPSDMRNEYFDYLFNSFETIEAGVTDIRGNRQEQKITGTLSILKLIDSSGEVSFPAAEFRNIQLFSVREGTWSLIHW